MQRNAGVPRYLLAAMSIQRSQSIFERARAIIPGGVNSPVRACRSVGVDPVFIARGDGARVTDADGNEYLDLIGSWGPLILGHCHPEILSAIQTTMASGTTFGATDELGLKSVGTKVDTYDLNATVLQLAGLDHLRTIYVNNGRSERPTVVYGEVIKDLLA